MKTLVLLYMLAQGSSLYAAEMDADDCLAFMRAVETSGSVMVNITLATGEGPAGPQDMILAACVDPASWQAAEAGDD